MINWALHRSFSPLEFSTQNSYPKTKSKIWPCLRKKLSCNGNNIILLFQTNNIVTWKCYHACHDVNTLSKIQLVRSHNEFSLCQKNIICFLAFPRDSDEKAKKILPTKKFASFLWKSGARVTQLKVA